MKRSVVTIVWMLVGAVAVQAQSVNMNINKGNEFYKQGQYPQAEDQYRRALRSEPDNQTALYNLSNTLQKQGRFDEAHQVLAGLTQSVKEPGLRSAVYYNQGVAFTKQKELDNSIESYKQSLRLNPNDQEARENLQKALLEKKKQQQKSGGGGGGGGMNQKEAEQRLKALEQRERELQQRLQHRGGRPQSQDW